MPGQPRPPNAPRAVPLGLGVQPGAPNIIVARRVIIYGANDSVLIYSATPAYGNLIASMSSLDGTDQYGNPVINGEPTVYTGNAQTDQFTSYRQNGVFSGIIQNGSAGTSHLIVHPQGGIFTEAVTPFDPVAGYPTVETWHPMTLGVGWAARGAGFAVPSYRLTALGDVELAGEVTNSSAANASVIATLPSGYYSASNSFVAPPAVVSGAANPLTGQTFRLSLTTAGQLGIYGISATGAYTVSLDGVIFPLSIG